MKPFILVLSCVLFGALNQSFCVANSSFYSQEDSSIVISPIPGNNPDPSSPRSPVYVPISASYSTMLTSLILNFAHNLGEIEVEVLNTISGAYYSEIVNTTFLTAILPVTMGSGHYIITFSLSTGQQFQGEFDI